MQPSNRPPSTIILKTTIALFQTQTSIYHYTLCQKKGQSMGFKHSRILVFNQVAGLIYYINQPQKWPQNIEPILSKPKNQKIFIGICQINKQKNSKQMAVMYNKKSDKDKIEAGQWNFVMQSQDVANQWVDLIRNKKVQRTVKALISTPKSSIDQPQPNPTTNIYNNDTMLASKQSTNPNLLGIPQPSTISATNNTNNVNNNNNPTGSSNLPPPNNNTKPSNLPPNTNSNVNNSNIRSSIPNTNTNPNTNVNNNTINTNTNAMNNSKISQNDNYLKDSLLKKSSTNINAPKNTTTNVDNTSNSNIFNPTTSQYNNPNTNKTIKNSQININQQTNPRNSSNNPQIRSTYINNNNNSTIPKPLPNTNISSSTYNNNNSSISNLNTNNNNNNNISTIRNTNPTPPPKKYTIRQQPNQSSLYNPNQSRSPIKSNKDKDKDKDKDIIDWNLKFIQQHTQQTITQFTNYTLSTFISLSPQTITLRTQNDQQSTLITKNGINFYLTSYGTKTAYQLNRQYQNYHYILECCKQSRFINVPLCCVVQYLGIFCLAKAVFPADMEVVMVRNGVQAGLAQQLRILQSYTKISSQSIKKTATILNLSKCYQKQGNYQRIFIDNLIEYLPSDPDSPRHVLRSQLLIQNLTKTLNLKHPQSIPELSSILNKSLHSLSQSLSEHQNILTSYTDIKQLLHQYGLNLSVLPQLYNLVRSRFTKKYIYTVMVCRIVKESVMMSVMDIRENGEMGTLGDVVEEVFRVFCEGDHGEEGLRQIWNNTAQEFKKKYRIAFNINQIQPGFFLSTLLTMMSIEFNLKKLDKTKKLMQDTNIIGNGFFVKFKPKIKSYYKYLTEDTLKILNLCKIPTNNLSQLSKYIQLTNPQTFPSYQQHRKILLCHLSTEISPNSSSHKQTSQLIYSYLNLQPPNLVSHSISLNYADHCLKQNRIQQYKKIIENCVDILNYWLGQDHILLCDVFQSLAQYYQGKGSYDDCINYMKQALTTCIRLTGTHTYRVGLQYFRLAQKQLKYGQTKQALQNYYKAKQNLQLHPTQSKQYPISLLRIANLELSSNNIDKCIIFCIKCLKQSQQKSLPDTTSIKIYQLLSRAYQLNTNKQQLLNLAHLTAKYYNNTTSTYVFDQMIRICLIGFIMVMQPGRQDKVIQYMRLLESIDDHGNGNGRRNGGLEKLMLLARNYVVMQKFYKGMEGIDRWISEIRHGRVQSVEGKQFKAIVEAIMQIVGKDFIQGILNQSKYW